MAISQKGIDLIKSKEGFRADSYQDSGGIWTIGYGSTMYQDGTKVGPGQTITEAQADALINWEVAMKTNGIRQALDKVILNQNQLDAIICFTYNVGVGAFTKSTLLKKIRVNPKDPSIRDEFMKWVNVQGKKVKGLENRRKAESDLYFM